MKSTMLCFALGGKLGNFGGAAPTDAAARACSSDNMLRRPMEPRPPVREAIQSRRERLFGLLVGNLLIDIMVFHGQKINSLVASSACAYWASVALSR